MRVPFIQGVGLRLGWEIVQGLLIIAVFLSLIDLYSIVVTKTSLNRLAPYVQEKEELIKRFETIESRLKTLEGKVDGWENGR